MEKIIINEANGLEKFLKEKEPFLFENNDVEGIIQRNIILAGFPGTGKSYAGQELSDKVLDCESSFWHWCTEWLCDKSKPKIVNDYWPMNYVNFIWTVATEPRAKKYICTSTHKEVLTSFKERGFVFYIVAPLDKEESLERYRRRGSPQSFIDSLNENWDKYMQDLESYGVPVIYTNSYISDLL